MKYSRFEDLPVWQAAIDLKLRLDQLVTSVELRGLGNWIDQIDRAALSVSNNVAEGFERGTTNELLAFLYIARGSAGEVRSMLQYAKRRPDLAGFEVELDALIRSSEKISRQLRGWAESLQNSDIPGQRHLNDGTRRQCDQKSRQNAFLQRIERDHRANVERWRKEMSDQRSAPPARRPGESPPGGSDDSQPGNEAIDREHG